MKDRFKFRAWIKSEKRYGYLLNLFNCGADTEQYEVEEYDEQGDYYTVYSSDEVVLQQCTGLKDKNGKLIFEGDIVEFRNPLGMKKRGIIMYDIDAALFQIQYLGFSDDWELLDTYPLKVVGNILPEECKKQIKEDNYGEEKSTNS